MKKIDEIKLYLSELPEKDKALALKLLEQRDFDELLLLVQSVADKYDNNMIKDHPNEELLCVNIDKVVRLIILLDEYINQL